MVDGKVPFGFRTAFRDPSRDRVPGPFFNIIDLRSAVPSVFHVSLEAPSQKIQRMTTLIIRLIELIYHRNKQTSGLWIVKDT
jgi:hypothetical protein